MTTDWSRYPDFQEEEFRCKCCGQNRMRSELLTVLQTARTQAGIPFRITSGYRCPAHNRTVGGVADSAHTRGYAVDIAIPDGASAYRILTSLVAAGCKRIGIAGKFIHIDVDPEKPQPVLWNYR